MSIFSYVHKLFIFFVTFFRKTKVNLKIKLALFNDSSISSIPFHVASRKGLWRAVQNGRRLWVEAGGKRVFLTKSRLFQARLPSFRVRIGVYHEDDFTR